MFASANKKHKGCGYDKKVLMYHSRHSIIKKSFFVKKYGDVQLCNTIAQIRYWILETFLWL